MTVAWLCGSACNLYDGNTLKHQKESAQRSPPPRDLRTFDVFDVIAVRAPEMPINPRINNGKFPSSDEPDAEVASQPAAAGMRAPRDDKAPRDDQAPAGDHTQGRDQAPGADQAGGEQGGGQAPRMEPPTEHQELETTEDAGVVLERSVSAEPDAGAREVDAGMPRPIAKASSACNGQVGYVSEADGRCYFMLDARVSWNVGRDRCYERDAHLATITSEREAQFVARFELGSDVWIGFSRFGAANFSWITNEEVSFTNWKKGAPHAMQESGALIVASTGLWTNRAVGELHPALCETERKASRRTGTPSRPR